MAMLGLAFSKVVPGAVRAVNASPRVISRSISSVRICQQVKMQISPICISHHYSTDLEFVKIMDSEIKSKPLLKTPMSITPAGFPFRIENNPCKKSITLRREIDGEKIDVEVMPIQERAKDDDESDVSDSGDDEEECRAPCLNLFVNITKENGKTFNIKVCASAHEIRVRGMSIKEPVTKSDGKTLMTCSGYYVVEQDSDLECALRELVEHRGIEKCYVGFLNDYMLKKSTIDSLSLLSKLKNFIED